MFLSSQAELIIFDLDGTLADTIADIASSVNRTLVHFGFAPHPTESYKFMVGEGFRALMQKAVPNEYAKDEPLIQKALDIALKDYSEHSLVATSLFSGVKELLQRLSERGYKLAILSNKPDQMTKSLVADLCGNINFVAVWGNSEERPRKPDPTAARQISALAGVAPEHSMFVGDSAIDILTAKAAGMIAVGALYGYRSREELEAAGAEYLIGSPLELLDIIELSRMA